MSFANSASLDTIQSVSVSTPTRVPSPDPHVQFLITVALPSRSYTLQQRYSSFESLHSTLTSQCGAPPPRPLPPKHSFGLSRFVPFKAHELSEEQLRERTEGLNDWVRAIVADRDPRWRSSRVFKEFLAAPPGGGGEAGAGAAGGATTATSEQDWTPTSWMVARSAAEDAVRHLRTLLATRDTLLLSSSSAAHSSAKEVKLSLVDLVRRLTELTRGLEVLGRGGMTQGEVQRRSAMVQRLQGDVEELGKKAGSGPRVGSGRNYGGGGDGEEEAPSVARQALLGGGGNAPTRVLGAPAKGGAGVETAETRPLDNGGIMQLQQQYMDEQDTQLEGLTAALRRQRHLGEMINQELVRCLGLLLPHSDPGRNCQVKVVD